MSVLLTGVRFLALYLEPHIGVRRSIDVQDTENQPAYDPDPVKFGLDPDTDPGLRAYIGGLTPKVSKMFIR